MLIMLAKKTTHLHIRRPRETPIITTVLVDRSCYVSSSNIEVTKCYVANNAPTTTSWQSGAFVRALWCLLPNPCLDVSSVSHVFIVSDDFHFINCKVFHGRVFEVLSETTHRYAVPASASDILDVYIITPWLNSYTVLGDISEEVSSSDISLTSPP